MRHVYPAVPDMGARLKTMLSVYREAGGKDACIVFHDPREGRAALLALGRRKGLPARALPLECFHPASVGIDLLLGAIAYGASQVRVLVTEKTAEGYVAALKKQMGYAEQILQGLGYAGEHFGVIEDPAVLWEAAPAASVARAATFNLAAEKRTALDFAFDHLSSEGKSPPAQIPLSSGAPFGTLKVNKDTCTLCKACIGACPESALLDSP
jgi:ferredoxin